MMRNTLRVLIVLTLLGGLLPLLSAETAPFAILTALRGDVRVSYDGVARPAMVGEALKEGFVLHTGADGRATVVFRDGNLRIVPKNARWSLHEDAEEAGTVAGRTGQLLQHVLADAAAGLRYDTITGMRAVQRKKAKREVAKAIPQATSARPEPAPAPPMIPEAVPRPQVERRPQAASDESRFRRTEESEAPMSRLDLSADGVPAGYGDGATPPAWLPGDGGRISRNFPPFALCSGQPTPGTLFRFRRGEALLLEFPLPADGQPVADSLAALPADAPLEWQPGAAPPRRIRLLDDTEEAALQSSLAELDTLPSETDKETREWLEIRILLHYGLEAEAFRRLQRRLPPDETRPLPHLRVPLIDLYLRAGDRDSAERELQRLPADQ